MLRKFRSHPVQNDDTFYEMIKEFDILTYQLNLICSQNDNRI